MAENETIALTSSRKRRIILGKAIANNNRRGWSAS